MKNQTENTQTQNALYTGTVSKIARLPKNLREHINQMLDDGRPHREIVHWLAERGESSISEKNISRWKRSGYIDWQNSQVWRQELHSTREFIGAAAADPQEISFQETALLMGTLRIIRHLRCSTPDGFQKLMADKPHYFISLLHCLVGINAQQLRVRKFKQDQAQPEKRVTDSDVLTLNPGLRPENRQAVESDLNLC